jgi:hypothetical protein
MMTELEVMKKSAEIILDVVNNPKDPGRKSRISRIYHISPSTLTPEKLHRTNYATLFRLMMGLAQEVPCEQEIHEMLEKMKYLTLEVAEMEDGTPEAIIKAHEGSIIGRKKARSIKKDKKK